MIHKIKLSNNLPSPKNILLRYLATLIILCTSTYLHGQDTGLRLNLNTDIFPVVYKEDFNSYEESQVRMGRISAAILFTRGKFTHDLEVFAPQVKSY